MSTEKQIEANRENAQNSTGPKTEEGKSIVAKNAVQHGIFAKEVVITAGDGKEDENVFEGLLNGLVRDLLPVGQLEYLLVEKITANFWRLCRLIRYEVGSTRCMLDNTKEEAIEEYYESPLIDLGLEYFGKKRVRTELSFFSYNDVVTDNEYRTQCERVYLLKNTQVDLKNDEETLSHILGKYLGKEVDHSSEDLKEAQAYYLNLSPKEKNNIRIELLGLAKQILAEMGEVRFWQKRFDYLLRMKVIPSDVDIDKIIKYECSLERSISRNLATLKALQEQRLKRVGSEEKLYNHEN